jgi:hypothetical protein
VPASRIVHLVGQASGVTGSAARLKRRPRYVFESRHRYFRRHYGTAGALAADLVWASGYSLHTALRVLRRRPRVDPPWLLWDFVRYNLGAWRRGWKR